MAGDVIGPRGKAIVIALINKCDFPVKLPSKYLCLHYKSLILSASVIERRLFLQ